MITKNYSKNNKSCQVTFELPAEVNVQSANLCGEFNAWDTNAHPMKRRKDGSFTLTLSLDAGRQYRFRYWLDGERWENDSTADGYAPNPFGSEDSLVQT
ncbi:isoamylase early set domain-containing protein [bacterium]|nr:isoamylase early set domain-containing protein [bacterium]